MAKPDPECLTVEWRREGDGWIGRWLWGNDYGGWGQLWVEPTGGLHGGWRWHIKGHADGTRDHDKAAAARREAVLVARAVLT